MHFCLWPLLPLERCGGIVLNPFQLSHKFWPHFEVFPIIFPYLELFSADNKFRDILGSFDLVLELLDILNHLLKARVGGWPQTRAFKCLKKNANRSQRKKSFTPLLNGSNEIGMEIFLKILEIWRKIEKMKFERMKWVVKNFAHYIP